MLRPSKIRTSVGLKMLIYLSLPAVIIFLLFTSVSLSYVQQASYRDYLRNASGIVKAAKTLVGSEDIADPAHFQLAAEKIAKENRDIIKLHLHLPKGKETYTVASTRRNEIGSKSSSIDAKPLHTGKDSIKREGEIVEVHTPIYLKKKLVGVIGVYLSTAEEQSRLTELTWHLVELGLLAAILLTAMMYIAFTRVILRPLSRLERSTKKLAQGNYEFVPIDRGDEIGHLAKQFNFMLNTIERKNEETAALYRKLEQSYKQARSQAITDELTGLYNNRYFRARLDEELSRSDRKGSSLTLAFVDIDNFKNFNDEFGHQAGDEALKSAAGIIKNLIRNHDLAARYGGEELVVVFPETSINKATIICERIRLEIQNMSLSTVTGGAHLSVSIGLASYPENASSAKSLIHEADKCMYLAKRQGKNQVIANGLPSKKVSDREQKNKKSSTVLSG